MECKITFSLLEESLAGNIGDDWEYSVEAKVSSLGPTGAPVPTGSGKIDVPEHRLRPGTFQAPPGPAQSVVIPAGDCATRKMVELTVNATEVDWFVDDEGSNVMNVPVECPGPDGVAVTIEREISVGVREAPGFLGGSAVFRIKVRLVAACG